MDFWSTFGLSPNPTDPEPLDSAAPHHLRAPDPTSRARTVRSPSDGLDLFGLSGFRKSHSILDVHFRSCGPDFSDRTSSLSQLLSLPLTCGPHTVSAFFHLGQKRRATRPARSERLCAAPSTPLSHRPRQPVLGLRLLTPLLVRPLPRFNSSSPSLGSSLSLSVAEGKEASSSPPLR